MLLAVVNISEGRHQAVVDALAAAAGDELLDVHLDRHHHRSVFTIVGEEAARRLATEALRRLDLRRHRGVHPRMGVVDVVPFVPLAGASMDDAMAARERYAAWSPAPCVSYGADRPTLPAVRRSARARVEAHPRAGITAVGARPTLVAYNLWLEDPSLPAARDLAAVVRSPVVRALGLAVGDAAQVSMNLVEPLVCGPAGVYDAVAAHARISRAELVGLVPRSVLDAVPVHRWEQLDLDPDRTIEARLGRRRGGSAAVS